MHIPYGRQSIGEEDINAVVEVLRSEFLTQGPVVPAFEQAVATHCGARFSFAMNSATSRRDVGFLFVGRGSDAARLERVAQSRQLENVVFFDEIDPDEIPDLYAQCHAGIVALDSRHKSHNIPGKFLTYMQSGLPVLANINQGNDLAQIIRDERVGQVCETHQVSELLQLAEQLLDQIETDAALSARCTDLFQREFAVANTVKQIVAALSAEETRQP